jgi:hypothetical protein
MEEFVEKLQKLIDSQRLLDDLLNKYNVYEKKFDMDDNYLKYNERLDTRIRNYLKFDDSE